MSALADSDWEKATLFPSTVLFTPFLCILGDFQKQNSNNTHFSHYTLQFSENAA